MIDIRKKVRFTPGEYSHIHSLISTGLTGPEMWNKSDIATKNIKRKIGDFYLGYQKCRCVYCESPLREGGWAIEHFAPKGLHREFTFHPKNLFAACCVCNSTRIKGVKDTVNPPKSIKYRHNTFTIIHPYFDNPAEHLSYVDEDKTVFDKAKCTRKGKNTIDFFHWDTLNAYQSRRLNALSRELPGNINQLIAEISIYH